MNTSFFGEMLQTISERGRALLGARDRRGEASARSESLVELCEDLLSGRGEASGVALAREILGRYAHADDGSAHRFFRGAGRALRHRIPRAWSGGRRLAGESLATQTAAEVHAAAEPRRQELFRRLNLAPGGTAALVRMREQLMDALDHRRRSRPPSMRISSICSRPGSIAASWCCGASTGRRRRSSWKRSSATRRCTRSAAGTICAAASIRRTGAATPSSIRRWWTSR